MRSFFIDFMFLRKTALYHPKASLNLVGIPSLQGKLGCIFITWQMKQKEHRKSMNALLIVQPSGEENKSSGERFFWHWPSVEGYYPTSDSILFYS